jgi:hypothetical protein
VGAGNDRGSRPTWQESERRVSDDLDWADFDDQRSFQNGKDVDRGAPGSTRPDNYSESYKLSVDVKNYDLVTSQGRSSFIKKTVEQMKSRAPHLPDGTRQGLAIDVRGQNLPEEILNDIRDRIVRKADGMTAPDDIVFITE